jgi:D-serine deaminase-like pyridoxal phosphate-dependent protein
MPCRPERYALAPGSTTAKSRAVARSIIDHVLKLDPGFRGIMAFPLDEALWLHGLGAKGVLVDYPSTNTARQVADRTSAARREVGLGIMSGILAVRQKPALHSILEG